MPYKDYEKHKENNNKNRRKPENKEKQIKYHTQYRVTEKGRRSHRISEWKYRGLKEEDPGAIYDRYINTHECDCCKKPIKEGKGSRVMDHCHKTGKFRNVLCHNCNILRGHLDNNYQAYIRMLTM
jgi:hypothetical protein